jgi:hypothetical protein
MGKPGEKSQVRKVSCEWSAHPKASQAEGNARAAVPSNSFVRPLRLIGEYPRTPLIRCRGCGMESDEEDSLILLSKNCIGLLTYSGKEVNECNRDFATVIVLVSFHLPR